MGLRKYAINLEGKDDEITVQEPLGIEDQVDSDLAASDVAEATAEIDSGSEALDEAAELSDEITEKIRKGEAVVKVVEAQRAGEEVVVDEVATEDGEEELSEGGGESEASAEATSDDGKINVEVEVEVTKEDIEEAKDIVEDGEVPVEEVVAVQESLNSYYKMLGLGVPDSLTYSRESAKGSGDSLERYKANLEGLKDIKNSVVALAKKVWAKIVEAAKWLWSKMPTAIKGKKAKAQAMITKLNGVINSKVTPGMQTDKFEDKYIAISYFLSHADGSEVGKISANMGKLMADFVKIYGAEYNQKYLDAYRNIRDSIVNIYKILLTENGYKKIDKDLDSTGKRKYSISKIVYSKNTITAYATSGYDKITDRGNKDTARKATSTYSINGTYPELSVKVLSATLNAYIKNIDQYPKFIQKAQDLAAQELKTLDYVNDNKEVQKQVGEVSLTLDTKVKQGFIKSILDISKIINNDIYAYTMAASILALKDASPKPPKEDKKEESKDKK